MWLPVDSLDVCSLYRFSLPPKRRARYTASKKTKLQVSVHYKQASTSQKQIIKNFWRRKANEERKIVKGWIRVRQLTPIVSSILVLCSSTNLGLVSKFGKGNPFLQMQRCSQASNSLSGSPSSWFPNQVRNQFKCRWVWSSRIFLSLETSWKEILNVLCAANNLSNKAASRITKWSLTIPLVGTCNKRAHF